MLAVQHYKMQETCKLLSSYFLIYDPLKYVDTRKQFPPFVSKEPMPKELQNKLCKQHGEAFGYRVNPQFFERINITGETKYILFPFNENGKLLSST